MLKFNSNQYLEVKGIVTQAQAELNAERIVNSNRIDHVAIDHMVESANLVSEVNSDSFGKQLSKTHDRVVRNVSGRQANLERKWNADDEYFDYLFSIAPTQKVKKSVEDDPNFSYLASTAPASKATPKVRCSIKKRKNGFRPATYIPSNHVISSEPYVPVNKDIHSVKVLGYRMYPQVIVIDIVEVDERVNTKISSSLYDRGYTNEQIHEYIENQFTLTSRDEDNVSVNHVVFVYEPYDRFGRPNENDGITILKNFLASQKFEQVRGYSNLGDALDNLVGEVVDFPTSYGYNYTSSSDRMTVYTLYGDIDESVFEAESHAQYQPISEFVLRDMDSESVDTERNSEVVPFDFNPIILKYDCHKEFRQQLPLEYSHIGQMFD